jgi:hypothetical protein
MSWTVSRSKRNGCSGKGEDSGGSFFVGLNMVKPYDFCGFFNDLRWQKWGFYLVGGLEPFLFLHILGINGNNSPNWLIFFRGFKTTNQYRFSLLLLYGFLVPIHIFIGLSFSGSRCSRSPRYGTWPGCAMGSRCPTTGRAEAITAMAMDIIWDINEISMGYVCT